MDRCTASEGCKATAKIMDRRSFRDRMVPTQLWSDRNLASKVAVSWELPDKAKPLAGEGKSSLKYRKCGQKVTLHREICRRDCKFSQAEARLSAKICCRTLARADPERVADGGGHVTAAIAQNGHLVIGLANSGSLPHKITIFFGPIP
ncbi:hypothetical protein EDD15DRAFT_2195827 [Pisolithus albus]|nr:hypothetical protein EDD15DRAFT_2195827 [Pisolithus albus]